MLKLHFSPQNVGSFNSYVQAVGWHELNKWWGVKIKITDNRFSIIGVSLNFKVLFGFYSINQQHFELFNTSPTYLKFVSTTFLLVCFLSLNESTCETGKNVFYIT